MSAGVCGLSKPVSNGIQQYPYAKHICNLLFGNPQVDPETNEIAGVFESLQPSDTDLGSKAPKDVKIIGIWCAILMWLSFLPDHRTSILIERNSVHCTSGPLSKSVSLFDCKHQTPGAQLSVKNEGHTVIDCMHGQISSTLAKAC